MTVEVGQLIARVLEGAGQGIQHLRNGGSGVTSTDFTIEVLFDDETRPSAAVRIVLRSETDLDGQPV